MKIFTHRSALALGAAALLLGACSSGDETVVTAEAGFAKAVQQAAARSSDATSQRLHMVGELDGETIMTMDVTGNAEGTVGHGTVETVGADAMDYLMVGGKLYYAYPDRPDGIDWVVLDEADLLEIGVDMEAIRDQSKAQGLAALEAKAEKVTKVGTENLDGLATTHYRARVDLAKTSEEIFSGRMRETMLGLAKKVDYDLWIDDDGFVRRMEYEFDLSKSTDLPTGMPDEGTLGYRMDMSDFNEPVEAETPPDEVVMSLSDYREHQQAATEELAGNI